MKYINQAPKELKAQSAAFKKKWTSHDQLVYHGWIIQPKFDGVHVMIHTDGYVRTRTGEEVLAVPHLLEQAQQSFGPGHVLFCEAYKFGTPHKDINGAVRRQYPQPDLIGIVYDTVTQAEFDAGASQTPYWQRFDHAAMCVHGVPSLMVPHEYQCEGKHSVDVDKLAMEYKNHPVDAYDGLILRDATAPWAAGAAKEGEVIKVKPSLTLDLEVIWQFAEQRATKLGGYLTVTYNGVPSDVGSGLTQAMLADIMGTDNFAACFVGNIAEIECLGITPDGKLREPRFKGFRFDTVSEEMKE